MSGISLASATASTVGLPEELCNILKNLNISKLGEPVWNLSSKPGFGICLTLNNNWRQNFEKTHVTPKQDKEPTKPRPFIPASSSSDGQKGLENTPKRKKKSPSTRRRNRTRLLAWKAKKRDQNQQHQKHKEATPDSKHPAPRTDNSADNSSLVNKADGIVSKPLSLQAPVIPLDSPVQLECTVSEPQLIKPWSGIEVLEASASDTDSDDDFAFVNRCFNFECMIPEPRVPGGLKKCILCNVAMYCSRGCQTKHRRLHRPDCAKIAAERF